MRLEYSKRITLLEEPAVQNCETAISSAKGCRLIYIRYLSFQWSATIIIVIINIRHYSYSSELLV